MPITKLTTIDKYYRALLDRDSAFAGIFYVGVKTTSVFCIATCRARKPLLKNVIFYSSVKEALDHGFRPCKICRPTENMNEPPKAVKAAMELLKTNPQEKVSDQTLRNHSISPEVVRRWYKQHHGMTFHSYQRMHRISHALEGIKQGKNATEAALDAGYESLSGFGYTYKKMMGNSPNNSTESIVILIDRFTTPVGPMVVCATEKGVCLLEFADREILEKEFSDLQKLLSATMIAGENEHIKQAKKEIREYFSGERRVFEVSLHIPGTDFQKAVWEALQTIPYGKTVSYQHQANLIGRPTAMRAVASANGSNRIAIILPCHRVIGKNGKLTGYGGGIERKKWLLELEGRGQQLTLLEK